MKNFYYLHFSSVNDSDFRSFLPCLMPFFLFITFLISTLLKSATPQINFLIHKFSLEIPIYFLYLIIGLKLKFSFFRELLIFNILVG